MSQTPQERILRLFLDKELTKECVESDVVNLDEVLLPGEEWKATIWVRFTPFKETHLYEIHSVSASGDAQVLGFGSGHRVLKAGESFPIHLLWTGRFMTLRDLEDHSAKIEINGMIRSR